MPKVSLHSFGNEVADSIARIIKSFTYMICLSVFMGCWLLWNTWGPLPFDPYPFEGLRLLLALQTAYIGPLIMMSQSRQSEKDRAIVYEDYLLDKDMKVMLEEMSKRQPPPV